MGYSGSDIANSAACFVEQGYEFLLVSNRLVIDVLDPSPWGVQMTVLDVLAPPSHVDIAALMRVYLRLNELSFERIGMPPWVMVDLGVMPSAFILIVLAKQRVRQIAASHPSAAVAEQLDKLLATADDLRYDGPLPVVGYCAAATPVVAHWSGFSLCSLLPGLGLGTVAKGVAIGAYRARSMQGVTQYSNPALRIHRKWGRMRLLAATVPMHDVPNSLVYGTDLFVDDDREPSFLLDARDAARQNLMQQRLDAQTHAYFVMSPGLTRDERIPILEVAT